MRFVGFLTLLTIFLVPGLFHSVLLTPDPSLASFPGRGSGSIAIQSPAEPRTANANTLGTQLQSLFCEWKAVPEREVPDKVPSIKGRIDAALASYVAGRLGESPRPPAV